MILSNNQLFSDKQVITATARSTNVIDLGAAGTPYGAKAALSKDVGKGTKIPVLIQVTDDFATLTSLTITIENSANEDLSSSTVLVSQTIAVANLKRGAQFSADVLPNGLTARYLGVRYTVGGSNATTGKITAGITMGNQTNITGA